MMNVPLEKSDGNLMDFFRFARQIQLENRMRDNTQNNPMLQQVLSDVISENVWNKTDDQLLVEWIEEMADEKFKDEYPFDISKELNGE